MAKKENREKVISCPVCGSPVYMTPMGHQCSGRCGMTFTIFGNRLTNDELKQVVTGERTLVKLNDWGKEKTAYVTLESPEYSIFIDGNGEERARFSFKFEAVNHEDEKH